MYFLFSSRKKIEGQLKHSQDKDRNKIAIAKDETVCEQRNSLYVLVAINSVAHHLHVLCELLISAQRHLLSYLNLEIVVPRSSGEHETKVLVSYY